MIQKRDLHFERPNHITLFARAFSHKLTGGMDFAVVQFTERDLRLFRDRMDAVTITDGLRSASYHSSEVSFINHTALDVALRSSGAFGVTDPMRHLLDVGQVTENVVCLLGTIQLLDTQTIEVSDARCEVFRDHLIFLGESNHDLIHTYEITREDLGRALQLTAEKAVV